MQTEHNKHVVKPLLRWYTKEQLAIYNKFLKTLRTLCSPFINNNEVSFLPPEATMDICKYTLQKNYPKLNIGLLDNLFNMELKYFQDERWLFNTIKGGAKKELEDEITKDPSLLHHKDHNGCSLSHYAAEHADEDMVEYLIKQGVSLYARDHEQQSPIFKALKANKVSNCQLLLSYMRVKPMVADELLNFIREQPKKYQQERQKIISVLNKYALKSAKIIESFGSQPHRTFQPPQNKGGNEGNNLPTTQTANNTNIHQLKQ